MFFATQRNEQNNLFIHNLEDDQKTTASKIAWHIITVLIYHFGLCLSPNSPLSSILNCSARVCWRMMRCTSKYSLTTRCWCNVLSRHFIRLNPMKYFDFASRIRFILLIPFKLATLSTEWCLIYEFISNDHRYAVSNWTCTFFFFFLYLMTNGAFLVCTATYRTRAKQHG